MPAIKHLPVLLWYGLLALLLGGVGTLAWHDYAWFVRLQQPGQQPAKLAGLQHSSDLWRPWSLITPVTTGFTRIEGPFEVVEHNGHWLLEIRESQFSAPSLTATRQTIRVLRCPDGAFAMRNATEQLLTVGLLPEDDPLLEFCEL